jgi:hypothetical protein
MTGDQPNAHGVNGTTANPSEKLYPGVPYDTNEFHWSCSINNYQDAGNVSDTEISYLLARDKSKLI